MTGKLNCCNGAVRRIGYDNLFAIYHDYDCPNWHEYVNPETFHAGTDEEIFYRDKYAKVEK